MPRTKLVNGVRVPLTNTEELERDAEEAAWAALPDDVKNPPPPLSTEELFDILKGKGTVSDADRPRPKPRAQVL